MGRARNGELAQNHVDTNAHHLSILSQLESQEGEDSVDEENFQEVHQEVTQEIDHPMLLDQNLPKGSLRQVVEEGEIIQAKICRSGRRSQKDV